MYIETPRMIIRDFMPEDVADLHDIFGDAETMENCEPAYDFEKTKEFLTSFCIGRKGAVASYQHELIETHYREVDNMYRQIRGWRHDYRNHIQTMKAYAANGDLDAIKNYLDLLDEDLTTVDTVIKTGNPMTDAILNSKISLAKAKGIEVVADAHIPVKLKSSEIDLCCIIGNLFDNAIEASVKLPENRRVIRVYMDMKNTQLYISFTNFTAGKKMKKEGKLFRSTKGDGHGFGLVRIDAIVERLEGYISRNSEDGAFTTEILLPQV